MTERICGCDFRFSFAVDHLINACACVRYHKQHADHSVFVSSSSFEWGKQSAINILAHFTTAHSKRAIESQIIKPISTATRLCPGVTHLFRVRSTPQRTATQHVPQLFCIRAYVHAVHVHVYTCNSYQLKCFKCQCRAANVRGSEYYRFQLLISSLLVELVLLPVRIWSCLSSLIVIVDFESITFYLQISELDLQVYEFVY